MRRILPVDSRTSNGETSATGGGVKPNVHLKRRPRLVLAAMVIVVAVTGFFSAAYTFHFLGLGAPDCASHPTNAPNSAYLVVLMENQGMNVGFNSSRYHSAPWPIMNVTLGVSVTLHVVNIDTVESHGFAITRYFPPSLILRPGECKDVTFTTDKLGPFQVYCWIECSIHFYMQDGVLNVNPS